MGDRAIASLLETNPAVADILDKSVGYAVIRLSIAKVPVVGVGAGFGLVVDGRSGKRAYIKVSQFEFGSGLGAQTYKVVIIISDERLLDEIAEGGWHYEGSTDLGTGSESLLELSTAAGEGYQAFKIVESGAVASATIRAINAVPYQAGGEQK
jgi:hypothetical protein